MSTVRLSEAQKRVLRAWGAENLEVAFHVELRGTLGESTYAGPGPDVDQMVRVDPRVLRGLRDKGLVDYSQEPRNYTGWSVQLGGYVTVWKTEWKASLTEKGGLLAEELAKELAKEE